MPGKLRTLGGRDLVRIFAKFGFEQVSQRGSHAKFRRVRNNERQTLHVPMHRELRPGTLQAIYQQALVYIPEGELRIHFYAE